MPTQENTAVSEPKKRVGAPVTGEPRFPGGVGKAWEPGAFEQLLDDVTTRVFDAADDDGSAAHEAEQILTHAVPKLASAIVHAYPAEHRQALR